MAVQLNKGFSGCEKMNRKQKRRLQRGVLLTVIAIALLFLGGWVFSTLGLFGCLGGCCNVRVTLGVDATFAAEIDDVDADLYIGAMYFYSMEIDPWVVDLIKTQGLTSEAEFIAYMNLHYPETAMAYFGTGWYFLGDARFMADEGYGNMSTVGKSYSMCIPGVAFIPFMGIEVYYANGTFYDDFEFMLVDPTEVDIEDIEIGDIVNMTASVPDKYLLLCGETLSVNILGLHITMVEGEIDEVVVDVEVNGDEFEADGESFFFP